MNHSLHFVLTLITGGLWAISWMALWIGNYVRPWRCEHCGCHGPEFGIKSQLTGTLRKRHRPVDLHPPVIGARSTPLIP